MALLKDQTPEERAPTLSPIIVAELAKPVYAAAVADGNVAQMVKLLNEVDTSDPNGTVVQPIEVTRALFIKNVDWANALTQLQVSVLTMLLDSLPITIDPNNVGWLTNWLDKIWAAGTTTRVNLTAMIKRMRTRIEIAANEVGLVVVPADVIIARNSGG